MDKMKNIILNLKYQDKKRLFFISIFSLAILAINFYFFQSKTLGIIFFSLYLIVNSIYLGRFLRRILGRELEFEFFFSLFFLLFLISTGGAIFIVLYKIKIIFVFYILLVLSPIIFLLRESKEDTFFNKDKKDKYLDKGQIKILICLFLIFALSLFLLFHSRTGKFILSPWEVIHPFYLYFFGLATFIILWLIFTKNNWLFSLLLIIFLSFFLHSYLPVSYQVGFGGDKWRHLGAEKWLQEGNIYSPSLFGEQVEWQKIGPLKIPAVLIIGNKTSYASQWSLTIILSWLFKIDVYWIDLFLGFILCSLFIPIFLFKIGQFFKNEKFALLLAFLPNIFYSFQVYGAITLPNSFGFLFFLFVLIFWLKYLINDNSKLLPYCIALTLLSYFNYVLYFILLLEMGSFIFIYKKYSKNNKSNKKNIFVLSGLFFIFLLLIPILDKFSGFSYFIYNIFAQPGLIFSFFGRFVKELLAISSVSANLGFVTQGNFLYTQTGGSLTRTILFSLTSWIKWLSILAWFFVLYGAINFKKLKEPQNKVFFVAFIFFLITLVNYFIGQYLMKGSVVLSKRLDLAIGFFMMFPLGWGIINFLNNESKFISSKAKIFVVCLFLALISSSVYSAGPKLQTVTKDELDAAKYVWQKIKGEEGGKCVLANTWPLLALEYTSSRHLTTGGFPVYQEYAQPERVQLFNNMSLNPSKRYLEKAMEITGAEYCYFMTEKRWWNKRDQKILEKYQEFLGDYEKIGDVYIFRFSK